MRYAVWELDDHLRPVGELKRVRSASVKRDATGDAATLESAEVEFDADSVTWTGGWYRIDAYGDTHEMLGVFDLQPSSATVQRGHATVKASGSGVLSVADAVAVPTGKAVFQGEDGPRAVAGLLSMCPGGVEVHGTAPMQTSVVFGDKTSALGAAWQVLDALGWRLRVDGGGCVHVEQMPTETAFRVDSEHLSGIQDGLDVDSDGIGYTRAYMSDVYPLDVVEVELPGVGVSGKWRVASQSISLGTSLEVQETLKGDVR